MDSHFRIITSAHNIWESFDYCRHATFGKSTKYRLGKGPSLHSKLG
jgi:hypothetical protein